MNKVHYLKEQAARADRLARAAFDNLTTERLQKAAKDYRIEADLLAAWARPGQTSRSAGEAWWRQSAGSRWGRELQR